MERQFTSEQGEFKPNPIYWVPNRVVLDFFQNWGQPLQERVDILNEAIELAGFKDVKAEVDEKGWTINGNSTNEELFKQFYQELKSCFPKGKAELEVEAVRDVILKYQKLTRQRR